jgi:hypothetical protein
MMKEPFLVKLIYMSIFVNINCEKLFGTPVPNYFSSMEENTLDIPQLSEVENGIITSDFTKEEVFCAIRWTTIKLRGQMVFL